MSEQLRVRKNGKEGTIIHTRKIEVLCETVRMDDGSVEEIIVHNASHDLGPKWEKYQDGVWKDLL